MDFGHKILSFRESSLNVFYGCARNSIAIGTIRKEQKYSLSPQSLEFRDQMRPVSQKIGMIINREWGVLVLSIASLSHWARLPCVRACVHACVPAAGSRAAPARAVGLLHWAKCTDPPRLRIGLAAFHRMALIQGNFTSWSSQTWMLPARRTSRSGSGTTFWSST